MGAALSGWYSGALLTRSGADGASVRCMTRDDFITAVRANPINRIILDRLPQLGLSDAWLVSGALFQTVWNVHTGRDPQYGIKDYDIFYFDPETSWDAEDAAIRKGRAVFADVTADIEVRNQARVHLWYTEKFGTPYSPLLQATDGIDRFLMHAAQVGICRTDEQCDVYAPHGFDDVENMIIRPNRTANYSPALYLAKAERWKALWPGITVLPG